MRFYDTLDVLLCRSYFPMFHHILHKILEKSMMADCIAVAYDSQVTSRSGDGNIDSSVLCQETNFLCRKKMICL